MPLCPHCGKEVSFLSYAWNGKNYNRNFTRFNRIYSCNNCGEDFSITLGSRLLSAVPPLLLAGMIYLNSTMKLMDIGILAPILMLTAIGGLYAWWKVAAKLEPYQE